MEAAAEDEALAEDLEAWVDHRVDHHPLEHHQVEVQEDHRAAVAEEAVEQSHGAQHQLQFWEFSQNFVPRNLKKTMSSSTCPL